MFTRDIAERDSLQEALRVFFRSHIEHQSVSEDSKRAQEEWRMWCFQCGLRYSRHICETQFDIRGKKVLDAASGWGGHALAFANCGAAVIATDLEDHQFGSVQKFSTEHCLRLSFLRAACERLPFQNDTFDVILALELVEHIDSVSTLAHEVKRLLRSGGVCILTTPPRLRSLVFGEPHWGLRGLTLLPLKWQEILARSVFHRDYPLPIRRQYVTDSQVLRPFQLVGLRGYSFTTGRLFQYLHNIPIAFCVAKKFFWDYLLIQKPHVGNNN